MQFLLTAVDFVYPVVYKNESCTRRNNPVLNEIRINFFESGEIAVG